MRSSPGSPRPTSSCSAARASTWPSRSTSGARRRAARPASRCTCATSCATISSRSTPRSPGISVGVWALLSWRYGAYVLPSPLAVVRGLGEILSTGEVWTHTGASLARILVGFGGAVALAILTGLAAFVSPRALTVVHDVLAVLNATSVFVWIVLSIIWFGLSHWAPIFTTLMLTLPVVASNIVEGVESVDRRL